MCASCDCNSSRHVRTVRENRSKAKRAAEIAKQLNTVLKTGLTSCQYHPTFWSTELIRTWKEPKDGWNLWRNFYVCQSRPHQYQRLLVHNGHSLTPMGKIKSCPISRNIEPYVTWTILWYFAYLETSRGFTIQCLSSKTSASPLFLSTSCFQAGKLSVERPQTARKYMWFNESTQKLESHIWMLSEITSRRIVLIVFPGRSTTCRACRSWF